jgi:hypothetical protein
MTPAASAGALTVQLDTTDLQVNVSIVLNVSGITGTETENQLSFKVYTQLITYYTQNNYLYSNIPPGNFNSQFPPYLAFPDQIMLPLFSITRTDHCICIMSQCAFEVSTPVNATGSDIEILDVGVLCTLADAKNMIPVMNLNFQDPSGNPLTDAQLIYMLKMASSGLIKFLRNFVVSSTILEYYIGFGTSTLFVKKTPMIDFYPPVIRRPTILSIQQLTTFGTVKSNFACDRNMGSIYYRFSQTFLDNIEPFEDGNEIMIAYIAGYKKIPMIIKEYVMRFAGFLCSNNEYESSESEGFKTDIRSRDDVLGSFSAELHDYFNQ